MEAKTYKYKHSPCFNYSLKDVTKFKKKIKNKFYSNVKYHEQHSGEYTNKKIGDEKDRLYYFKYTQYIQQKFNSSMINMIISYINRNNSFPKINKNEINFNYKICNLIKHLLMNEIEIACFTLLLEKIGLTQKNEDQWLYLTFVGILSKKILGRDNDAFLLTDIISRNNSKFMEEYSIFIKDKDILSILNENKLKLKEINERFILLSKPVNTYCIKNYINIFGIIDQIVKTAQPYYKSKTFNEKHKININNDNKKSPFEKTNENNTEIEIHNTIQKLVNFDESFVKYNEINFDEIRNFDYEKSYYIDDLQENDSFNMNWTISDLGDENWLRFKDIQNI